MYVMLCTRPDIVHEARVTRRYQLNQGVEHWKAIKNIIKYLRKTKDLILTYGERVFKIDGDTNFDFQIDPNDKKSAFGCVHL